jgi:D-alanine-D-alanine ligase-like ATP-grasp enzyme
VNVEPYAARVTKWAPQFVKDFVDALPPVIFRILKFMHLAKFSDDLDQVATFRSRVIWEEARKRGIEMQQIFVYGKALEFYRAKIQNGKKLGWIYFDSLPIPKRFLDTGELWDNKSTLKHAFIKHGIPVPKFVEISAFKKNNLEKIFDGFVKPIIVKPRVGSRARHTTTNINTLEEFKNAIKIVKQITPYIIVEEHLYGDVCRATVVDGKLAGFYRGSVPEILGDGVHTVSELIEIKNKNRPDRIGEVEITSEINDYISRAGFTLNSIPKLGEQVKLTHRTGRLHGGITHEMIDELHPSFVPILEKAGKTTRLAIAGFDCIVPDPLSDANSQKWGIIECNTLPFIDLHYYALKGKPRNIAGMIWDLWKE